MKEVDRVVSILEAKSSLLSLILEVEARDEVVAITKSGSLAAVLVSVEKFEELLEIIDALSGKKETEPLRRSLREARLAPRAPSREIVGKK